MTQTTTVATQKRLRILITGASGLVGSALCRQLQQSSHTVVPVSRSRPSDRSAEVVVWNPAEGELDGDDLQGADAIVHLAGESIAAARWSERKKQAIRDSRVKSTTLLSKRIADMPHKPSVLVCASAVGLYGHRGNMDLTEQSSPGDGFLADVCMQWEAACQPARDAGVRVVNTRLGMVLSGDGGALKAMLLPFRLGVGGVVGSGQQWWSWIALVDCVRAIEHAIMDDSISGPMNVVSPNPVTNREFTKTLGKVISRPTVLPLPAFAARLMMADMADELLLASAKVHPGVLEQTGFTYEYSQLEPALRTSLGR